MIALVKGAEFKKWAERGCRIYGEDDWSFLRELAQNSRDAGATRIDVEAALDREGFEVLRFQDDGDGMSMEHARRFLFRLYSSSKEGERHSAGQYGIGFWSILRFGAKEVVVESVHRGEAWGISIGESFKLEVAPCELERPGVRVTLKRFPRDARRFPRQVEAALKRYCRYLRRCHRKATPLPVYFEDKRLMRPLDLPGPLTLRFKRGPVEGVVGLDKEPSVELLARGLPVWRGMLLDELSYSGTTLKWRAEIARGLSPVFLLNGNALDVVMSRNAVIDDHALSRVRKYAQDALGRLVQLQLERTFPAGWWQRIGAPWRTALRRLNALPAPMVAVGAAVLVTLLLALAVGPKFLERWKGRNGPETAGTVDPQERHLGGLEAAGASGPPPPDAVLGDSAVPNLYKGSLVEAPSAAGTLRLSYSPPVDLFFKFMTATDFDAGLGFVERSAGPEGPYPACHCFSHCVAVTLELDAGGRTVLPVPTGYGMVASTVTLDGAPLEVMADRHGAAVALLPEAGGVVRYVAGPHAGAGLSEEESLRLRLVPEQVVFPEEVAREIESHRTAPVERRVAAARAQTATLLAYDDGPQVAANFGLLDGTTDWFLFVLELGRGDCDVLNAMNVLLLRSMGVPARLAVGVVGRGGRVLPGLHAWTEYHGNGWGVVDASRTVGPGGQAMVSPGGAGQQSAGSSMLTLPENPALPESADVASGLAEAPASVPGAEPPEEAVVSPVPGAAPSSTLRSMGYYAAAAVLLLCGLLLLFVAFARPRGSEAMRSTRDPAVREELLGEMALSAVSQPEAWHHAGAIFDHAILPTVDGWRISLRQAFAFARKGVLFAGAPESADRLGVAGRKGAPILDRGDKAFGRVARHIPGIVDLDEIVELQPVAAGAVYDGDSLFGQVNRTLRACGSGLLCLPSPGLSGRDFADVDLSAIKGAAMTDVPARFIALRPHSEFVEACLDDYESNRARAAYRIIERITAESLFLKKRGRTVRRAAALRLLKETV